MAKKYNRYIIDGHSVNGSTTIIGHTISKQLAYWRGKVGNAKADEISNESKLFGDKVHKIIEAYINGQELVLTKPFDIILQNFKLITEGWEFIEVEKEVLNKEYKYGGTVDIICKIDGKLALVDVKTGNLYDNKEMAQLASYDMCLNGIELHKILQLDKDIMGWELLDKRLDNRDYVAFLAYKIIMDHQIGVKDKEMNEDIQGLYKLLQKLLSNDGSKKWTTN